MKLEPMNPAPPVTRMIFCMPNVARFRGYCSQPCRWYDKHLIVINKDGS